MTAPSGDFHRQRRKARQVELGASVVAGGVGSAFGAAKLRDAYRDDPKYGPQKLARGAARAGRAASRVTTPHRANRVAHLVEHGKPSFRALVAATAAGGVAAAANKYQDATHVVEDRRRRKKIKVMGVPTGLSKRTPFADAIAKSEVGPGQYKPANQMTRADRAAVRIRTTAGVRGVTGANAPTAAHDLASTYAQHGAFMGTKHGVGIMHEPSVPSPTHPNIRYGASIPAQHHAALDAKIDPALAAKSRHPIVIHHDAVRGDEKFGHNIYAGAVGAHQTTGGVGHVVMHGTHMKKDGSFTSDAKFIHDVQGVKIKDHQVLNHELVHAQNQVSPQRHFNSHPAHTYASAAGEEARADALGVRGKGIYQRQGAVPNRATSTARASISRGAVRNAFHQAAVEPSSRMIRDARTQARTVGRANVRYHQVRDTIRAATKIHKAAEPFSEYLTGVSGRARETYGVSGPGVSKRVRALSNMSYDEVSLVDVPANQHALVMITKRHQGADMPAEDEGYEGAIFDPETHEQLDVADLEDGDVVLAEDGQAYEYTAPEYDFEDELVGVGKALRVPAGMRRAAARVGRSKRPGSQAGFRGHAIEAGTQYAASGQRSHLSAREAATAFGGGGLRDRAAHAAFGTGPGARTRRRVAQGAAAGAGAAGVAGAGYEGGRHVSKGYDLAEEVSKALSEAVTDADRDDVIAKFASIVDEQQARLTLVEKRAQEAADRQLEGEYIQVAKNLGLPVDPDELGPVLKRACDVLCDADIQVLAKALDATSGVLYEELGYSGIGAQVGDSELADAEAYAEGRIAKGAGEQISKAAAVVEYFDGNDDAYNEYLRNRG